MKKHENFGTDKIEINGKTYKLSFADDFDGTSLDTAKWKRCPVYKRHDLGGYWNKKMSYLDGTGNLIIEASISDKGVPISGAVRSKDKFEQKYGYFEIRCKLQSKEATGFWGAFWLLSSSGMDLFDNDGTAKNGVEIDIFESFNPAGGEINQALHWDGYGSNHQTVSKKLSDINYYDGNYHTFALLWDETGYYFFADGIMTWQVAGDVPASCEVPCYLKVTAEFGTWASAINKEKLPDRLTVDYVKVYTKE